MYHQVDLSEHNEQANFWKCFNFAEETKPAEANVELIPCKIICAHISVTSKENVQKSKCKQGFFSLVCLFFLHFHWNWSHNLQWHLQNTTEITFSYAYYKSGWVQSALSAFCKTAATKWRLWEFFFFFFSFFLATQNHSIKLDEVTEIISVHSCYWTMPILFCFDCQALMLTRWNYKFHLVLHWFDLPD